MDRSCQPTNEKTTNEQTKGPTIARDVNEARSVGGRGRSHKVEAKANAEAKWYEAEAECYEAEARVD